MFRSYRVLKPTLTASDFPLIKPAETQTDDVKADTIFKMHPYNVVRVLETAWDNRPVNPADKIFDGHPALVIPTPTAPTPSAVEYKMWPAPVALQHLIYAYFVENTRIFDIFRRVVTELVNGERFDLVEPESQQWLRTTEELFFRDQPPLGVFTVTGHTRPDPYGNRRNAYYRMFGMDLNHGTDNNMPYPYQKPTAANKEFVPTLELLLTEIWRGITNETNTSGAKDTDIQAIATLSGRLRDMLTVRRHGGALSREEFWYTATMQWFHLTISSDTPIIKDMKSIATSPDERLRKLGQRVGLPSHGKTQAFLELADSLSLFLTEIEAGSYTDPVTVPDLFLGKVRDNMVKIITQYSVATGRDLKARSVAIDRYAPVAARALNQSPARRLAMRPVN